MKTTTTEGPILTFSSNADYAKLMQSVAVLEERYPELSTGTIGTTILNRPIPLLTLGNPKASKSILFVGGMGGGDAVTSAMLLRFVNDYYEYLKNNRRMYGINLPYLHERRRILIVPMLNCDGCTLRQNGCGIQPADPAQAIPAATDGTATLCAKPTDTSPIHLLADRLLSMNGQNPSFKEWEANARGVDLRYNYATGCRKHCADAASAGIDTGGPTGYGGTAPESEPETMALTALLRAEEGLSLVLRLQNDNNHLTAWDNVPRTLTLARLFSRMTGAVMKLRKEPEGTLEDWCTGELSRPAFSLGCRSSGGEDDYIRQYTAIREALFSAGLLI